MTNIVLNFLKLMISCFRGGQRHQTLRRPWKGTPNKHENIKGEIVWKKIWSEKEPAQVDGSVWIGNANRSFVLRPRKPFNAFIGLHSTGVASSYVSASVLILWRLRSPSSAQQKVLNILIVVAKDACTATTSPGLAFLINVFSVLPKKLNTAVLEGQRAALIGERLSVVGTKGATLLGEATANLHNDESNQANWSQFLAETLANPPPSSPLLPLSKAAYLGTRFALRVARVPGDWRVKR